jgi:hypothetical protein
VVVVEVEIEAVVEVQFVVEVIVEAVVETEYVVESVVKVVIEEAVGGRAKILHHIRVCGICSVKELVLDLGLLL